MDQLKRLSNQLGGKICSQDNSNMNFKVKSFRALIIKDYKSYKINIDEYGNLYEIQIKTKTDFTLSINNPDKLSSIDRLIQIKDSPYQLYLFKESYNDFIKGHKYDPFLSEYFQLFWKSFSIQIKQLELLEDETLSIREDGLFFVLRSGRNLSLIVNDAISLIKNNTNIFKRISKKILSKNVPENLRILLPLMKKWSISDDAERDRMIKKTGERQKKSLISTVEPLIEEINVFLDSFDDRPLNEEAMLLGNLAELVSELKVEANLLYNV